MEASVKDTTAYQIVRQVLDHTWGSDSKLSDEEFLKIVSGFFGFGGSWERLMSGDMKCVKALEDSIDGFMKSRIASRIASSGSR